MRNEKKLNGFREIIGSTECVFLFVKSYLKFKQSEGVTNCQLYFSQQ